LVLGRFPPRGLVVFAPGQHEGAEAVPETEDAAEGAGAPGAVGEGGDVAELFGDAEGWGGRGGGDGGVVPLDEVVAGREVFGQGFLGQHVFAGGEGAFDEGGLDGDREGDDDGVDVRAGEEVVVVLVVKGVVGVEVDGWGEVGGDGLGGLERAGVDGFEGEVRAGEDGGEVLLFDEDAWGWVRYVPDSTI